MFNIANQLTLVRIAFIPLLVVVYYSPFEWRFLTSAALFGLAGITDWLDGYIARKYNLTTPFGAFLDPVADKLMVAVALAVLIQSHSSVWFTLPATVIICREIVISALREWMAELGKRAKVAVSIVGKVKTTLQIIAIVVLLMVDPKGHYWINVVGYITLYAAAMLTLWSMFVYLRAAWPSLRGHE
ncbi:CDP-diacylglycerol--glycerol-3-phosphate 3-phosphatidyltransferase [Teredinibacter turnerae]|uniref:CDP-diacylglycerol--glycerol-3-phosphate 3-phosphatidyltransferase n=1 Tax=Teredinibacter turnerae (strain ATCC 39867 / T7901) TaxID=377629 RepID=C5BKD9_TERTT|nr:CDP-diacylglycerol--glycerol-3-phosphate 3-phosphatidyltransferase [Teredinibacter turnerae]ACR13949.1 CDP-diacylglycerol--glycerol-3-phosphate 3-phosphatidyltransferase [Teredinibacter turnerae T7901]